MEMVQKVFPSYQLRTSDESTWFGAARQGDAHVLVSCAAKRQYMSESRNINRHQKRDFAIARVRTPIFLE
jgi:hypothetical protein